MERKTDLLSTRVVGMQHHVTDRASLAALTDDAVLTLHREPENPADSNAVAIHWQGKRIGYVAAASARTLSRLMDIGMELRVVIDLIDRSTWWPLVSCTVHLA